MDVEVIEHHALTIFFQRTSQKVLTLSLGFLIFPPPCSGSAIQTARGAPVPWWRRAVPTGLAGWAISQGKEQKMPRTLVSQAEIFAEAERMFDALQANETDLGHLAGSRDKLQSQLDLVRELFRQQAAFAASKQQASQQLHQGLNDLGKLVSFLRHGVREHYGTRSTKLVDFGLTPFRSRSRRVETPPSPPAPPIVE